MSQAACSGAKAVQALRENSGFDIVNAIMVSGGLIAFCGSGGILGLYCYIYSCLTCGCFVYRFDNITPSNTTASTTAVVNDSYHLLMSFVCCHGDQSAGVQSATSTNRR